MDKWITRHTGSSQTPQPTHLTSDSSKVLAVNPGTHRGGAEGAQTLPPTPPRRTSPWPPPPPTPLQLVKGDSSPTSGQAALISTKKGHCGRTVVEQHLSQGMCASPRPFPLPVSCCRKALFSQASPESQKANSGLMIKRMWTYYQKIFKQ